MAAPKACPDMSLTLLHLEAECASLRSQLSEGSAALQQTTERAEALEALLEETEGETVSLKQRADAADADAVRTKAELEAAQKALEEKMAEVDEAKKASAVAVAEMEEKVKEGEKQVAEEKEAKVKVKVEEGVVRAQLEERARACGEEVEVLRGELVEAKAAAEQAAEVSSQMQENVEKSIEEKASLETEVAVLKESMVSKEVDLTAKAEEVRRLTDAAAELQADRDRGANVVRELTEAQKGYTTALAEAERERVDFETELNNVTEMAKTAVADAQKDASEEIAALQVLVDDLRLALEVDKEKHAASEAEVQEGHAEALVEAETRCKEQNERVVALESRLSELEKARDGIAVAKDKAEEAVAKLESQVAEMEKSAAASSASQETAEKENIRLADRLSVVEDTNADLVAKIGESGALLDRVAVESREISNKAKESVLVAEKHREEAETRASSATSDVSRARDCLRKTLLQLCSLSNRSPSPEAETLEDAVEGINDVVANVEEIIMEKGDLCTANAELRSKVAKLEETKAAVEGAFSKLEADMESTRNDATEKLAMCNKLSEDVKELESKCEAQQDQLEEFNEKLREQDNASTHEIENLRHEKEYMQSQSEDKARELDDMKVKFDEAVSTISDSLSQKEAAEDKVTDIERELSDMQEKLDSQSAEAQETIDNLQGQLERVEADRAAEVKRLGALNEEAVADAENLNESNLRLDSKLADAMRELETLQEHCQGIKEELSSCQKMRSDSETLVTILQGDVKKRGEEHQRLVSERDDLRLAMSKAEKEIARLSGDLDDARKNGADVEKRTSEKLEMAINELEKDHAQAQDDCRSKHVKEVDRLVQLHESSVKTWSLEKEALAEQLQSVQKVANERFTELEKLRDSTDGTLKTVTSQRENLVLAMEKLSVERDELQNELQEFKEKNGRILTDLEEAKGSLSASTTATHAAVNRVQLCEGSIASLEGKLDAAEKEAEIVASKHMSEIEELVSKLEIASATQRDLEVSVSKVSSERNSAQSKLDHLQSNSIKGLKEDIDSSQIEIARLQAMLESKDVLVCELNASMDDLRQAVADSKQLHARLELADGALAAKDASLSDLQEQLKEAKEHAATVEDIVSERDSSMAELQEKVAHLDRALGSAGECTATVEKKLKEKTLALASAEQAVAELQTRQLELDARLEEVAAPDSGASEKDGEAAQQLFEALEKYDSVLEKNNRLRKRAKRFEALLEMERKKNAAVVSNRGGGEVPQEDQDVKRQISPSAKGLSPSVKRVREAMIRGPGSPLSRTSRPPLAPRPRNN